MKLVNELKPYRQGDLDWLCSVYAAINLRQLSDGKMDEHEAAILFKILVQRIVAEGDLPKVLLSGIRHYADDDMTWLLKSAGLKDVERHKWNSVSQLDSYLKEHSGVVLFFKGPDAGQTHYTTVRSGSRSDCFKLFDSWKYDSIELDTKAGQLGISGRPINPIALWTAGSSRFKNH